MTNITCFARGFSCLASYEWGADPYTRSGGGYVVDLIGPLVVEDAEDASELEPGAAPGMNYDRDDAPGLWARLEDDLRDDAFDRAREDAAWQRTTRGGALEPYL